MDIRRMLAATVAVAGFAGVAFAQQPVVVQTQTHTTETTSHEHTTTNTSPDGKSQSDTTKTDQSKSTDQSSGPATAAPAGQITWAVMPPLDEKMPPIPWSSANNKTVIPDGAGPGLYIWHDKNTIYVTATGGGTGTHTFSGAFEITGGKGRFDTVKSITAGGDDHFNQEANNRVAFKLTTDHHRDSFKFNLRDGEHLRIYALLDGQPTQNFYFGGGLAQARTSPVLFNLNQ